MKKYLCLKITTVLILVCSTVYPAENNTTCLNQGEITSQNKEKNIAITIMEEDFVTTITLFAGVHTKNTCTYGNEVGIAQIYPRAGELAFLKVRPQYRQQGYGSLLVKQAASYLFDQNCNRMIWTALPVEAYESSEKMLDQAALSEFYKKCGGVSVDGVNFFLSLKDFKRT